MKAWPAMLEEEYAEYEINKRPHLVQMAITLRSGDETDQCRYSRCLPLSTTISLAL